MAESKGEHTRTLEMRVAELEDKLAKVHITDEEMRTYEKVAAMLGGGGGGSAGVSSSDAMGAQASPFVCQISRNRGIQCITRTVPRIRFCYECTCGPCIQGGGFGGDQGGGFGGFGM